MIVIPLTKGKVSQLDDQDADLAEVKWCWSACGYAVRTDRQKRVYLHRIVLARMLGRELVAGECCDHINQNSLDNSRVNLRIATKAQNQQNQWTRSDNKSGVRGVSWDKRSGRWRVEIGVHGKTLLVGRFVDFNEAVAVRHAAELKYFGEFSPLSRLSTTAIQHTANDPARREKVQAND